MATITYCDRCNKKLKNSEEGRWISLAIYHPDLEIPGLQNAYSKFTLCTACGKVAATKIVQVLRKK